MFRFQSFSLSPHSSSYEQEHGCSGQRKGIGSCSREFSEEREMPCISPREVKHFFKHLSLSSIFLFRTLLMEVIICYIMLI